MWVASFPRLQFLFGSCLRRQGEGRSLEVGSRVSFYSFLAAEFGVFSIYRGFYITSEQSRLFIHHLINLVSQATPFAKGRDSDYWLILSRKQNSCYGQGEGSFYSLVPRLLFFSSGRKKCRIANNALLGGGVRVRVWIRERRKIKIRSKALLSLYWQCWTSLEKCGLETRLGSFYDNLSTKERVIALATTLQVTVYLWNTT